MDNVSRWVVMFVLNAAWQAPLMAGGAAFGVWLLRRWPARFHYRVWVAALLLGVLLPMWSLRQEAPLDPLDTGSAVLPVIAPLESPNYIAHRSSTTASAVRPAPIIDSGSRARLLRLEPRKLTIFVLARVVRWGAFAYALVLFWGCSRLLLSWGRTRKLRRDARRDPLPRRVRKIAARCRDGLGIRHCAILVSPALRCPVTVGILGPAVILPEYLLEPAEEINLTAALAHELAHVQRADFAMNLLLELLGLPLTFHPVALWIRHAIERSREMACDEVAAGFLVDSQTYARSLVSMASTMAQLAPRPRPGYSLGAFDGNNLEERVMKILEKKTPSRRWHAAAAIPVGGTMLAVACLVASMAVVRAEEPKTTPGAQNAEAAPGSIRGTTFDPSGARVPNAEIILTNEGTGRELRTRTGQTGDFSFSSLPTGDYSVTAEKPGFAEFHQQKLRLGPGVKGSELSIVLSPGEVIENVEVTALAVPGATARSEEPKRPQRIRVGGLVQATKLVHMVHPAYPEDARKRGVQGVVLLQAVISLKGEPLSLKVINSPDPELSHAATDAVKQWRYEPTLLNGEPIEVVTTIAVGFHLVQGQGS